MATIVIHGTMASLLRARHYSWWWDSFHPGGFCQAVADGIRNVQQGRDDVWAVGGVDVSELPTLARDRLGPNMTMLTHRGRYEWSGGNSDPDRLTGGKFLAHYLNAIARLAPQEPLNVIAHSHGGNILKVATMAPHLEPAVRLRNVVFLACPHWVTELAGRLHFPYRLNPQRVGRVLNLYSEEDIVQGKLAAAVTGGWSHRLIANIPTPGRVEADPLVRPLCENYHVATKVGGKEAHEVMHGKTVGQLVGIWLGKDGRQRFSAIAKRTKLPAALTDPNDGA